MGVLADLKSGHYAGRPEDRCYAERTDDEMMPVDGKLLLLAQPAAETEGLDAALLCEVVEQEWGGIRGRFGMRRRASRSLSDLYIQKQYGRPDGSVRAGDFPGDGCRWDGTDGAGERGEFALPFGHQAEVLPVDTGSYNRYYVN